jgi:ribonuclease HI
MSQKLEASPTHILIHTDGACIGNPGPGGCAAIIRWMSGDNILRAMYVTARAGNTTNIRMEMTAALNGLTVLSTYDDTPVPITVVSDSQTLVLGASEWMPNWQKRDWKKADGKPVANVDLWKEIACCLSARDVSFRWIKGHFGDSRNDEVDRLARDQAELAGLGDVIEALECGVF